MQPAAAATRLGVVALAASALVALPVAGASAADCTVELSVDIRAFVGQSAFSVADDYDPDPTVAQFPLVEPYSDLGYLLRGGEGASITTTAGVADWIVVELRDPDAPSHILATDVVPLLGADGSAVRPAVFDAPAGDYLIALEHRNHLPVMTADAVTLAEGDTPLVDFTDASLDVYNTVPANAGEERYLVGTRLQLVPGDVNNDEVVDTTDYTTISAASTLGEWGYLLEDIEPDGYVDGTDVGIVNNIVNTLGGRVASVPVGELASVDCPAAPGAALAATGSEPVLGAAVAALLAILGGALVASRRRARA